MKTTHHFLPGDRYVYDFDVCSLSKGFAQLDSDQDASYYGTWINPTTRVIVNYCEGDVTKTECNTDEELRAAVESIDRWNVEDGRRAIGIDPGFSDSLREAFVNAGLGEYLNYDRRVKASA